MDSYIQTLSAELEVAESLEALRIEIKGESIAQKIRMRQCFGELQNAVVMPVPVDNFTGYRGRFATPQ